MSKIAYLSPKLQRALREVRASEPVYDSLGAALLEPEAPVEELDAAPLEAGVAPVESGNDISNKITFTT